ncbi:MAG TPA: DUF1501 domain-containing protein [Pyrinomonadaceae bacterium]|nr:DUF1501 domain-containing protein [Pyrinomonadaceae bacterium]
MRQGACALAGSAALAASVERLSLVRVLARSTFDAANTSDYKALVCVFLDGGNDGANTIIPYDDYNAPGGYASVRALPGLAIPKSDLLPVTPPSGHGLKFGLHPSLVELQSLFNNQKLAVLCNTGTLVQPLTRALFQSGVGHPYQLFSHSDQVNQQQTAVATEPGQTGWGGRISDLMTGVNGAAPLPMAISTAGASLFTTGVATRHLVINPEIRLNEVLRVDYGTDFPAGSLAARRIAFERIRNDGGGKLVNAAADTIGQAVRAGEAIPTDPALPPVQAGQTDFPDMKLGNQLKQIAKLISVRANLGVHRQIFFCSLEGFDHHTSQHNAFNGHDVLLLQLSRALKAFYDATINLGVADQVTTFTLSDFGRTFEPSGTGAGVGSDHAWGNHHLILGDAVHGGDFYGNYPTLAVGGPDDADDRGRWIPTTSNDQYAATLALWFGLAPADLPAVFPFIGRFATPNLGFML